MNGLRLVLGELAAVMLLPTLGLAFAWWLPGPPAARLESLRIAVGVGTFAGGLTLVSSLVVIAALHRLKRLNVGQVLLWGALAGAAIPISLITLIQILSRHISFSQEWLLAPGAGAIVATMAGAAFCVCAGVPMTGTWPGPAAGVRRVLTSIVALAVAAAAGLFAAAALLVAFAGTVPLPAQPWRAGPTPGTLTAEGGPVAGFRIGQPRAQALAMACAPRQTQLHPIDLNCAQGRVDPDGVSESRPLRAGEDESWSFRVTQPSWPPCIGLDGARLSIIFAHDHVASLEATCAGRPHSEAWMD